MINVEEEVRHQFGAEIAADIDFEVIATLLVSMGWSKVQSQKLFDDDSENDVKQWVDQHCKGRVNSRGHCWLFEDERDAVNFTLRWAK